MGKKEPLESKPQPSLPDGGDEWIRQYLEVLEANFAMEASSQVSADVAISDFQWATVKAAIHTLEETGMTREQLFESIGLALLQTEQQADEWTPELDLRRIELIDKDIQETISNAERLELAGLTALMRSHVDSEANLPTKGAKELHKRLLEMQRKEKPR